SPLSGTPEEIGVEIRPPFPREGGRAGGRGELDGEEVARTRVAAGVAQLRHRPRLDLADALAGEVEVLADFLEGAGLAAVEAEAEAEDLALALVEGAEELGDLFGEEGGGRHLEGRLGRTVFDDVAELGVAVLTKRLGERQGFGREAEGLGHLVLGHLDL